MFKETLWNRLYEYLGQQADNEGSEIHRYLADWRKDKKISGKPTNSYLRDYYIYQREHGQL